MKKKTPSIKTLKAKADKLFSQYIRLRDADEGGTVSCFTCNALMFWRESQCGHGIPGRHNAVRYDFDICKNQCARCNVFMRGRFEIFTAKLIKAHGLEWFERKLESSRNLVQMKRADYECLIEDLKAKLESLTVMA